ncbi:peptide ABC transporter substrate-binding protein [uncultured Brachyspira sp.]|uniref:peptide ABC transporter substrate-binding protein n=1 Tax=uncultured Brachyspira sp. TaxID=221953 RepID=UPI0025D11159|nr:peptide ABC transporter substrate-binding protein [uncultured Brachyspira sp.]
MKTKIFILFIAIMTFITASCISNKTDNKNIITINAGSPPKTIDPSLNTALDGCYYIIHAFEGLTTKSKEGEIIGGAAENWEILDNGTKYIFHLRTNAKWSDGKPVTASDFVYSWKRVVDPAVGSKYSFQHEPVKNAKSITAGKMPVDSLGVKAADDYTLEVILEAPTAYFLDLVAFTTFYPIRKDIIDKYGDTWSLKAETYIGNGPFKALEINQDESIIMVKNTNYYNIEEVVPEKLKFVLMQNETASVAGIKEGSIDFSRIIPTQDIKSLMKEGLLQIKPVLASYFYCLNVTNEVLSDIRVRKALALAIDRNYIVEQVTKGGETPADAFVPYGIKDIEGNFRENGGGFFDINKENYQKNIEEAKRLIAEAGYPEGKGFPVFEFKSDPGFHIAVFEAVQQMWKEHLGIDTKIVQEEWAVFLQTRYDKNLSLCRGGWFGDFNDPINFLGLYTSYSPNNYSSYSNAMYDAYIQTALTAGDQKIRMEAMHKAEELLVNSFAVIPMYFYTEPLLINPKLKDVYYDALSMHKFTYAYKE